MTAGTATLPLLLLLPRPDWYAWKFVPGTKQTIRSSNILGEGIGIGEYIIQKKMTAMKRPSRLLTTDDVANLSLLLLLLSGPDRDVQNFVAGAR